MEGKRLIVSMVVGGRTQYRTAVQGMPKQVEIELTKMIKNFIWGDNSKPTISLETMQLPHEKGGKKLLNLSIRNDAIELMKTKRYLDLSNTRPRWAAIADEIMESKLARKWKPEEGSTFYNPFLQHLDVDTRTKVDGLPPSIQRMIRVAKKVQSDFLSTNNER